MHTMVKNSDDGSFSENLNSDVDGNSEDQSSNDNGNSEDINSDDGYFADDGNLDDSSNRDQQYSEFIKKLSKKNGNSDFDGNSDDQNPDMMLLLMIEIQTMVIFMKKTKFQIIIVILKIKIQNMMIILNKIKIQMFMVVLKTKIRIILIKVMLPAVKKVKIVRNKFLVQKIMVK